MGSGVEDLWKAYAYNMLGRPAEPPDLYPISPTRALELLWPFALASREQEERFCKGVPYDVAHDEAGDSAVVRVALNEDLEDITPEGWRVYVTRLEYVCVVFTSADLKGIKTIQSLPKGLSEDQAARTLLLRMLLGDGRAVDLRLLDQPLPEGVLPFRRPPPDSRGRG